MTPQYRGRYYGENKKWQRVGRCQTEQGAAGWFKNLYGRQAGGFFLQHIDSGKIEAFTYEPSRDRFVRVSY